MNLRELIERAGWSKLFIRFCDDAYHQCMTVISSKDYGARNSGEFDDEPDTVAITFHQLGPQVGCHSPDFGNNKAALIVELWNAAPAIAELIEAATEWDRAWLEYVDSPRLVGNGRLTLAENRLRAIVAKLGGK